MATEHSDNPRARALEAARSGNYHLARDLFERLREENPQDADALFYLGSLEYKQGRLQAARDFWQSAAKEAPDDPRVAAWLERVERELKHRPPPPDWKGAFGTLEDRGIDETPTAGRSAALLLPGLGVLAVACAAGFLFHWMGRFFWIPLLPAMVLGGIGGAGTLFIFGHGASRHASLPAVMVGALLAGLAYGSIHLWNALEFYYWGGAQRLYELEATDKRHVGAIPAREPIAGPSQLLRERVGRSDLIGYFIYEGRVGRVLYSTDRRTRRRDTPRLRRLTDELYWSEVFFGWLTAAALGGYSAKKIAQL